MKRFQQCDQLIKSGDLRSAVKLLTEVNIAALSREDRISFAALCRRTGLIDKGLRALRPIVRNDKPLDLPATPAETCEYAALLTRVGSYQEARTLLQTVKPEQNAETLLFQGYCELITWNLTDAVRLFEAYSKMDISEYSRLIAMANWANSLGLVGDYQSALTVSDDVIKMAIKAGAKRLHANALELQSHALCTLGQTAQAKKQLQLAHEMLAGNTNDQLNIIKGQAMIEAEETGSVEPLIRFRALAVERRHWDSIRDADFMILRRQFDQKLFDYLILGSPYKGFHERVRKAIPQANNLTCLIGNPDSKPFLIDTCDFGEGGIDYPGAKVHRALSAVVSDFYAPKSVASLFSSLCPDEYYDVDSSPFRVRQVIYRLKQWLAGNKAPIEIVWQDTGYHFKVAEGGAFQVGTQAREESSQWLHNRLRVRFGSEPFSVKLACDALGISKSSFYRAATEQVKSGNWSRSRRGKQMVYSISENPDKAA